LFVSRVPRPPTSPPFPYTTLFRSGRKRVARGGERRVIDVADHRAGRALARNLGEKGFAEARRHLGATARGRRLEPAERHVLQTRSEEHTSELQSLAYLVCRLLLEK